MHAFLLSIWVTVYNYVAGHGTHVAGLVGANGLVVGMAPDVILGANLSRACPALGASSIRHDVTSCVPFAQFRFISLARCAGAYRVGGCDGSFPESALLAAVDQARTPCL